MLLGRRCYEEKLSLWRRCFRGGSDFSEENLSEGNLGESNLGESNLGGGQSSGGQRPVEEVEQNGI